MSRKERKLKKVKRKVLFWDYFLENWVLKLDIKSPCKYAYFFKSICHISALAAFHRHYEILGALLGKSAVLQPCVSHVLFKYFQEIHRNPIWHCLNCTEVNCISDGHRPEPTSGHRRACLSAILVLFLLNLPVLVSMLLFNLGNRWLCY